MNDDFLRQSMETIEAMTAAQVTAGPIVRAVTAATNAPWGCDICTLFMSDAAAIPTTHGLKLPLQVALIRNRLGAEYAEDKAFNTMRDLLRPMAGESAEDFRRFKMGKAERDAELLEAAE